jgi:hypothetical protein
MSERSEEGDGLDTGASGVIAPTEGGLKPVAKERERAARGGGRTPRPPLRSPCRRADSPALQCASPSRLAPTEYLIGA